MRDLGPDFASAAEEWLSTLDLDADQLAALRKSMTDITVAISVDVVGMDSLHAYEFAKAEAGRLWTWSQLSEAIFEASEPEAIDDGVIRVGVLVGVTALDPVEAVRSACAEFQDRTWSEPAARTVAAHQFSYWTPNERPEHGPVRVEVHAAPGLITITERERQEMLDDPNLRHLHD
ncbi:MAG: hypothetical protein ACREX8_15395 [Gammaproteobacteria bacterium]